MFTKNIMSWPTWKKHNNPKIYYVRDGVKGWACETIHPTLQKYGFTFVSEDYDYGLKGTKQWASEEADFYLTNYHKNPEHCEFVYWCSRGSNGYMDYRAIYVKENEICLENQ